MQNQPSSRLRQKQKLNKQARAGSGDAAYQLGVLWEDEGRRDIAIRYYEMAHERNTPQATYRLGVHTKDPDLIMMAAERGVPEAMFVVGAGMTDTAVGMRWWGMALTACIKRDDARSDVAIEAAYHLALVLFHKGKIKDAKIYVKIALPAKQGRIYYLMGCIFEAQNKSLRAVVYYRYAINCGYELSSLPILFAEKEQI
jgi:tetratricopeptide (TPR) repeat protein